MDAAAGGCDADDGPGDLLPRRGSGPGAKAALGGTRAPTGPRAAGMGSDSGAKDALGRAVAEMAKAIQEGQGFDKIRAGPAGRAVDELYEALRQGARAKNPMSRTMTGYTLVLKGDYREALALFGGALRARPGLVAATLEGARRCWALEGAGRRMPRLPGPPGSGPGRRRRMSGGPGPCTLPACTGRRSPC